MTVTVTNAREHVLTDGSTGPYTFTFLIFAETDLVVYRGDALLALNVDYTVSGGPWAGGGTITLTVAGASGDTLTMLASIPQTQNVDYLTSDVFPSASHENALDRLTRLIHQHEDKLSRTIRPPIQELLGATDFQLPTKVSRRNKFLRFADTVAALPEVADLADADLVTLSQSVIAALLYPQTLAEQNAGVTPVSFQYPPGNALRYGADNTRATSSSTALDNMISALPTDGGEIDIPDGEYLLTSKWTINKVVRMICGDHSPSTGTDPSVKFVKDSTLNDDAINMTADGGYFDGFSLEGEVGNGGDGIHIGGNSIHLRGVTVAGMGRDGFRIGNDGAGNCNSWRLDQCVATENVQYGFHIHSNTAGSPDANAGLATNCIATLNTSHGFYLRNNLRNTLVAPTTEANGGDGIRVDTPSLQLAVFGGDQSEGNTGFDIRIMAGASSTMLFGVGVNASEISDAGDWTMIFAPNYGVKLASNISGETLGNGVGPTFTAGECYAALSGDAENRIIFGWKDGTPTTGRVAAQIMAATSVLSLVARDIANSYVSVRAGSGIAEVARFDDSATATHTRFMIYDVDNATLERVTVGAADSGGVGFKVLRIAN